MMIFNTLYGLASYLPAPPITPSKIKQIALTKIGMTPLKRSEKMQQLIQKLGTTPLSQKESSTLLNTVCQNLELEPKYQQLSELLQDPKLAPLQQFVRTYFPKDQEEWPYGKWLFLVKQIQPMLTLECDCCTPNPLDFLQVFLGIKPFYVFTCSAEHRKKLEPFIQSMVTCAKLNSAITIHASTLHRDNEKEVTDYYYFFSHSKSLPLFNPQKYLKSCQKDKDAVQMFSENKTLANTYDNSDSCQELAYFFGYGPTFLSYNYYILKQHYKHAATETDQAIQKNFMYTEEHYRQMGEACLKLENNSSIDPEKQKKRGYAHTRHVLNALSLGLPYPPASPNGVGSL